MAVAALPDGHIVSGSMDKTLRIWNVESRQTIAFVYGDTSFRSLAVICEHFIAAGDGVGNVWFIGLPFSAVTRSRQISGTHDQQFLQRLHLNHFDPARAIDELSKAVAEAVEKPFENTFQLRPHAPLYHPEGGLLPPRPPKQGLTRLWHALKCLIRRLMRRHTPANQHDTE
jgi:hypothetical protein